MHLRMIHIAIAEDEKDQQQLLYSYLQKFAHENNKNFQIELYSDGIDLLSSYKCDWDILLLDIQMQRLDGMKAAQIIREKDENVIIIFITNLVQYAVQGYSVDALNYIVKPVNYDSFANKLLRAVNRIEKRKPTLIILKTINQGLIRLNYLDICYCEVLNRKLFVHTSDDVYQCNQTLNSMQDKLACSKIFFRCHSAFLINLQYVEKVMDAWAMVIGKEIPVSRRHKKNLIDALTNYLGDNL